MKIDLRKFKIEKAASKNTLRTVIEQPYLDVDAKVLVATDSFMLAVVPVEVEEGDTSGPVPVQAITEARRRSTKDNPQGIALNGRAEVDSGEVSFKRPTLGQQQFPAWAKIADENRGTPIAEFGVSPFLLARLAEAIGVGKNEAVKISVYGPLTALGVETMDKKGRGILMPVRLR